METVRLKAKGTEHKHCTVVGKVLDHGAWVNNLNSIFLCTEIKQVNGWQMLGDKFFIVGVVITEKQRGTSCMIHLVLDKSWGHEHELMCSLI